jgi:4-amino-4-deoxy-L-arabinose transferase-like glycosyltransferase
MFQRAIAVAIAASHAVIAWGSRSHARSLLLLLLVALLAFLPGQASLPVTDRDEGRYVLATKQMLETGDYVDIRNQDQPRHKQPAGIYWAQALAVHAAGDGPASAIAVYRLPSLLGALLAVLLTWWTFLPLVGRQAALLGAMLLASTLLLGVEARIAKTDAVLLAVTMLGMGVLLRAFLDPARLRGGPLPWVFWAALGAGAMIKGPITLLVLAMAALGLCLVARSARWLLALRPWPGVLLALAIALPWYVAIALRTEGAFFATALGWNALGKVTEVHQGHGGPPGLYLALVWVTFWPGAPLLAAALGWIWTERRRREVQVLLALVLPLWVVFEVVATKLPHYVLPTYPALAVLVVLPLLGGGALVKGWWSRLAVQGFWLTPALLLGGGFGAFLWFGDRPPVLPLAVLLLAIVLGVLATVVAHRSALATVPAAVAAACVTWLGGWPMVARLDTIWPSPRLAAAARAAAPCPDPALASAGYHEPSLVFLTRTDTRLTDGPGAAEFLAEGAGGCRIALVDAEPGKRGRPSEEIGFRARLEALGLEAVPLGEVDGRNLNGGRPRRMVLWRLEGAP